MTRQAVSPVAVTLLVCVGLALGIWALLAFYYLVTVGSAGKQMLSAWVLIFFALGLVVVISVSGNGYEGKGKSTSSQLLLMLRG